MKRSAHLLALLTAALFLTACGSSDPHEAAIEDVIDVMADLESTLGKVTDAESVSGLSSDFDSIGKRLAELSKQMAELEEPSEEKAKELEEKYKPQAEALQAKMEEQMARIKGLGPDVMIAAMQEMQKIEPSEDMPEWMK
jgi:predicted  nucleic acid-binding Zn-ribbon protein